MTGREIGRALLEAVINDPNISVFEHHSAIDLAFYFGNSFQTNFTSCSDALPLSQYQVATGDGMAMAHRAEAVISNMDFVQFHPTALADEGLPIKPTKSRENAFLITEAVRGDGGILYNLGMEWFMPLYDERAELAPRDVVARGIDDQLKQRNEKLLDFAR
ncbi:hypothetical protein Patl1_07415 [Pistacia atlantica]|uniref:Uncharacterized protein n=1 Tax=Pistacia atlantica TaxID=434234 RepID=A0ACC1AH69_9ROSI|nr:hypothetical protein Patl1_07415 [Pistacia atlantica]